MSTTSLITNLTHQTNFRLDIPDNNATIMMQSAVQRVSIPGIEMEPVQVPTNPLLQAQLPGSSVRFEPLNLTMLIDENLDAYCELYTWMLSINDYREMRSTATLAGKSPRTIMVHVLDNSHQKTLATFRFFDAWPSSLGQLDYTYSDEGNNPVTCDVTFYYKYFEVERNGVVIKPR